MKTIILITVSFLCVNLFAQHQAQFDEETPHKKVFKEVFNDSSETAQNGGTISNVTFSDGKGSFNGSSSKITYPLVNSVKSIRIKLTATTTTENILKLSSTHSISVSSGTISATGLSSPTIYVDGSVSSTLTTSESEIIITTATGFIANDIQVGYITSYFEGSIDLIEFFNITLSSTEVNNLYNNKRYEELNVSPVLEVSSESGTIVSDSSFVNTGVDVVRDGSIWVMDFDGVSDYIESVDNILGDEDFTISFWVYSDKINQEDVYLFSEYEDSDNRWYIRLRANLGLQLYSEVGGVPATNTDFTTLNTEPDTWNYIGLSISRSDSMYYKYLNGELVHSAKGSSDFTLDLDNAGKFEIGRYTGSTYGKMKLSDFKIDDVVWTDEEFSQYYTSTKRKYGK